MKNQDGILQSVCRSLKDGVVVADKEGKFLFFNEAAEKIIGIGLRDVSPADWPQTYGCFLPNKITPYPPDELPLARALRGEVTSDVEIFIKNSEKPDGVWLSVSGTPLRDEAGNSSGGVVVLRDITDRKKSEEQLRKFMKQLADMKFTLDQAAVVAITDHRGDIVYANDKFCQISGYSHEELIGQNHRIVNSGYHPPELFRDMWKTIGDGQVWRGEIRNQTKDGAYYWVDTTIVPFLDGNGKPEQFIAIRHDITERKKGGEVVRRLSNAVEQTADSVFITDRQGMIEYVNPAFEKTTGYTREEAVGKTPRILKSGEHDQTHYKELWKRILGGDVHRGMAINRKKNGEIYYAEQTITPMKNSVGEISHFVSVIKDMTERKRIEEMESEMRLASMVQKRLYPQTAPTLAGFDVAAAVFSAEATCGDYYDYIETGDDSLCVAIGDVSGHGLGPAMVMTQARVYLRSFSQTHTDPGAVLANVNSNLVKDLEEDRFVTLLVSRIDASSGRLVYANAGHPPGYILDRFGSVRKELEATGLPLGVYPDSEYSTDSIVLHPGDTVVLLTDGIMESRSPQGEYFGAEGALEVVRAHRDEPAKQIVALVQQAVRDFANGLPQDDDVTIIVCKMNSVS